MFLRKKWIVMFSVITMAIFLTACGSDDSQKTLEGLKNEFINEEFEVGDNKEIAYEMVNADNGMKFELDGELIEIYQYNIDDLSDEAEETVEQAKKGSMDIIGFNVPAKYNDGIMLVNYDDHSQEEKIIKVFNNY